MSSFSRLLKRLEVKPTDDEYESIATTRWGNKDVYVDVVASKWCRQSRQAADSDTRYPVPRDKRTYDWLAFWAYWGEYLNEPEPYMPSIVYNV